MLMMSCWLKRPWPCVVPFVAVAACLLCVAATWPKASGQTSPTGRVVGLMGADIDHQECMQRDGQACRFRFKPLA
jgi:hypothetical protein